MVNKIKNYVEKNDKVKYELMLDLQYKIKLKKEDLINIKYPTHWAKQGMINPIMLSNKETKVITDTFDIENLPYSTPEEALVDFLAVKIIVSSETLLYIVNIPKTTKETYYKFLTKPVKRNNLAIEIPLSIIANSNFNEIYERTGNCKNISEM